LYSTPTRTGGHHKSGLAMLKNLQKMQHHIITVSVSAVEKMVREIEETGAEYIAVPEMKNILEKKNLISQ
jgi:UDP-N-acetylglucosamine:LPS N-acetylglucosamine transferase